ncbi:MAG: hypothetical protein CSA97_01420 [Bacteroidetes bacterium]|nr:MAG: hypothetical protein CSA97_01420 [Bacteroidota bacterium]
MSSEAHVGRAKYEIEEEGIEVSFRANDGLKEYVLEVDGKESGEKVGDWAGTARFEPKKNLNHILSIYKGGLIAPHLYCTDYP